MFWTPARHPRDAQRPLGFVTPCQPTLVHRTPLSDGWLHEIKFDGFRIVARKDGERVRLWSRHGNSMTAAFPRIVAAIAALPATSCTLDGEAMVQRADGYSDFNAMLSRRSAEAVMVAFDILEQDGEDLRGLALEDRRTRLERDAVPVADGLVVSQPLFGDGATIFAVARERGLEGIVSKRLGSLYRSGRSTQWVKSKNKAYSRT